MNLDRDLRDAMEPFGGDPVADAARVLGALGPAPAPGPFGLPKVAWWVGAAALGLGLLGGWAVAHWSAPAVEPAKRIEVPKEEPPKEEPKKPDEPKKDAPMPGWQSMAAEYAGVLDFTAFGPIAIDEPGVGQQALKQGPYRAAIGTTFTTKDSLVGIYLWANDARVRLGTATVATVDPQMVTLTAGRVWLSDITRPALVRVRTDLAEVEVDAAVALVERRSTGLWVCSFDGPVTVRPEGGAALRLLAMQQVEIDTRRGAGPVEKVPFAGSVTSWMTQMIVSQQDSAELNERIGEMVFHYLDGAHRDAASVELRRLGSHGVPRLYEVLDKTAADPELLHRTVALLTDLAEFAQAAWLFALLERDDEQTRVLGFRALVRVTGLPVETEAFWRTAPLAERDAALLRWRQRVK